MLVIEGVIILSAGSVIGVALEKCMGWVEHQWQMHDDRNDDFFWPLGWMGVVPPFLSDAENQAVIAIDNEPVTEILHSGNVAG